MRRDNLVISLKNLPGGGVKVLGGEVKVLQFMLQEIYQVLPLSSFFQVDCINKIPKN